MKNILMAPWWALLLIFLPLVIWHPLVGDAFVSDVLYFSVAIGASYLALFRVVFSGRCDIYLGSFLVFLILQSTAALYQAYYDWGGVSAPGLAYFDLGFGAAYFLLLVVRLREYFVAKTSSISLQSRIDPVLFVSSLALLGYEWLFVPSLGGRGVTDPEIVVTVFRMLYPVSAFVLLSLQLRDMERPSGGPIAAWLALIGWVAWSFAEATFHLTYLTSPEPMWYSKMGWLVGYVLLSSSLIARIDFRRESENLVCVKASTLEGFQVQLAFFALAVSVIWVRSRTDAVDWVATCLLFFVVGFCAVKLIEFQRRCARYEEQLDHAVKQDGLTGATRWHFMSEDLVDLLVRARQTGAVCYVALLERVKSPSTDRPVSGGPDWNKSIVAALLEDPLVRQVSWVDEHNLLILMQYKVRQNDALTLAWSAVSKFQSILKMMGEGDDSGMLARAAVIELPTQASTVDDVMLGLSARIKMTQWGGVYLSLDD